MNSHIHRANAEPALYFALLIMPIMQEQNDIHN